LKLILLFLALVAAYWFWLRPLQSVAHPPGILVSDAPLQTPTVGENRTIQMGDWSLTLLTNYLVEGRILAKKRYRFDATSDLSPYDLLLGWGPMSDTRVLRQMSFEQTNRFGLWEYGPKVSLSPDEITLHAANNHLIPANDAVRARLDALKIGQVVTIRGKLIEARRKGFESKPWRSSLIRTDEGTGACEIIYVETVSSR